MPELDTRYIRQQQVAGFGAAVHEKIKHARVAVVGCGGLGCPAVQYLAGAGVGQLTLVDPDSVALHNLHRQVLFAHADIGQPKVQMARQWISACNPDLQVTALETPLKPDLAMALAAEHDVILDCADRFAVTLMLDQACASSGAALISASAVSLSGYVVALHGRHFSHASATAPGYRSLFPRAPEQSASCAEAGVLGPVTGILGSQQALWTLLLYSCPETVLNRLWQFSAVQGGGRIIDVSNAPLPEQHYVWMEASALTTHDLVIDLRSQEESPQPVVAGALRLRVEQLPESLPNRPRDRVVLCCTSGLRAWRAADRLSVAGYRDLAFVAP